MEQMAYYINVQIGKKDWRIHFNNAYIVIVTFFFFFIKMGGYSVAWYSGRQWIYSPYRITWLQVQDKVRYSNSGSAWKFEGKGNSDSYLSPIRSTEGQNQGLCTTFI